MANTDAAAVVESSSLFSRLWKKVLVYPTMITAFLGAIPTAYDLYKAQDLGVGWKDVAQAEEQAGLWQKNFVCASQMQFQSVKTASSVGVDVGACPTGDVLIKVSQNDKTPILQWISLQKIQGASLASLLGAQAFAADSLPGQSQTPFRVAQAAGQVSCQSWAVPGKVIIRIVNKGGTCHMEKVNVLNGKTLESKVVPCTTQCPN